ncbi:MAG: hypothetical protein P8Z79_00805 [Sedimentisphaerales bacterium]
MVAQEQTSTPSAQASAESKRAAGFGRLTRHYMFRSARDRMLETYIRDMFTVLGLWLEGEVKIAELYEAHRLFDAALATLLGEHEARTYLQRSEERLEALDSQDYRRRHRLGPKERENPRIRVRIRLRVRSVARIRVRNRRNATAQRGPSMAVKMDPTHFDFAFEGPRRVISITNAISFFDFSGARHDG